MEHHHLIKQTAAALLFSRLIRVVTAIAITGVCNFTVKAMPHFKAHHIAVVMVWNHTMRQKQYIGQGGKQYGRQVFGHINPFVAAKIQLNLMNFTEILAK